MGLGSSRPPLGTPEVEEALRVLGEREITDLTQLFAGLATGKPPSLDVRGFHGLLGGALPSVLCERLFLAVASLPGCPETTSGRVAFENLVRPFGEGPPGEAGRVSSIFVS